MNRLMTTFILSLVVASGCDSGTGEVDVPDGGVVVTRTDAGVVLDIPTTPFPYAGTVASDYTASGVTGYLGHNNCANIYADSVLVPAGWEPGTEFCWRATQADGRGGICGVVPPTGNCSTCQPGQCACMPTCGTYAPGTLRVWSVDDSRYSYKGDPATFNSAGSGGYVCLPNVDPYVVPCA